MARPCDTCIYRADLGWHLEALEDEVRDRYMGFAGFRVCHHAAKRDPVCCRGFWNAHKDEFAAGQIAQRLDLVEFVEPLDEVHHDAT
jgi:hypothetical protein